MHISATPIDTPPHSLHNQDVVARKRGGKLLVVEDDRGMRALTARAGGHMNMQVFAVESVAEALEVAAEEELDALVVDYFLPDGTGGGLVEELQERLGPHRPPALLVTATPEQVPEAQKELFIGMLAKPFRLADLYDAIEEMRKQRKRARSGVRARSAEAEALERSGTED